MSNDDASRLNDEVLARWEWFYRKSLIGRRDLLRAIAVAGGSAALAACAPAPPAAAKASGKDAINVAFNADLPTLDPQMHNQRNGIIWQYHVNDNLGVRDPKTNRIVPHLATSWTPSSP